MSVFNLKIFTDLAPRRIQSITTMSVCVSLFGFVLSSPLGDVQGLNGKI